MTKLPLKITRYELQKKQWIHKGAGQETKIEEHHFPLNFSDPALSTR